MNPMTILMRPATVVTLCLAFAAGAASAVPVFLPASVVPELSSQPLIDVPNSISLNGLELVFCSRRNGGGFELFKATRASTSSPFSVLSQADFVNINGSAGPAQDIGNGIISATGLELFYSATAPGGFQNIFRATRADVSQPFSNPQQVPDLVSNNSRLGPAYLSADGLRLYYGNSSGLSYVTSRISVGDAFGPSTHAPFASFPYTENYYLTPDELQVFASTSEGMQWSSRPDLNTPFSAPAPITSITTTGGGFAPVFLGYQLFFVRNEDIYRAEIPEPAGLGLLALIVILKRRR